LQVYAISIVVVEEVVEDVKPQEVIAHPVYRTSRLSHIQVIAVQYGYGFPCMATAQPDVGMWFDVPHAPRREERAQM
jgi:hypothetical protein